MRETGYMAAMITVSDRTEEGFSHEAVLYSGDAGFFEGTVPFIHEALSLDEPILVAVTGQKIPPLRAALGDEADKVGYADLSRVGRNPARIIPFWREFVDQHAGRRIRGIGEPVWPERSPDELVECERHEALLNLAFADTSAFRLLCPYDQAALGAAVIEEAKRNHPGVLHDRGWAESSTFRGLADVAKPFDLPLPEPTTGPDQLSFDAETLADLRRFIAGRASAYGLDHARTEEFVLATDEVATNSVRHGGGTGELRMWRGTDTVISEIRDGGRIADPLVGRVKPGRNDGSGFGLWLANRLCDLVQVRTSAAGSVVRLHMSLHRS